MKILRNRKPLLLFVFAVFFAANSVAQDNNVNVTQDAKFEKLLNEKRKIYAGNVSDDNFKIQIFNGTTDDAKKTLMAFRKEFPEIESTVIFSTPNYKVVAGNFKTRIEAEHYLLAVKKLYANALLIRPRR